MESLSELQRIIHFDSAKIRAQLADLSTNTPYETALKIENTLTLDELEACGGNEEQIKEVLINRLQRIRDSFLVYSKNKDLLLNKLCLKLNDKLASLLEDKAALVGDLNEQDPSAVEENAQNDLILKLREWALALKKYGAKRRDNLEKQTIEYNQCVLPFRTYWESLSYKEKEGYYRQYAKINNPSYPNLDLEQIIDKAFTINIQDSSFYWNLSSHIKSLCRQTWPDSRKPEIKPTSIKLSGATLKWILEQAHIETSQRQSLLLDALAFAPEALPDYYSLLTEDEKKYLTQSFSHNESTPLIEAVKKGCLDSIQLLIQHQTPSAYLFATGTDQYTALHWAVKTNRLDIVKVLIAAEPTLILARAQTDRFQQDNILDIAIRMKQPNIVSYLIQYANDSMSLAEQRHFLHCYPKCRVAENWMKEYSSQLTDSSEPLLPQTAYGCPYTNRATVEHIEYLQSQLNDFKTHLISISADQQMTKSPMSTNYGFFETEPTSSVELPQDLQNKNILKS